jgi:hypothetical protein
MSRIGENETAYAGRDTPFLVTGKASSSHPAQNDEALVRAGYGDNYQRLKLKAKYDPTSLFRMNHNITPSA